MSTTYTSVLLDTTKIVQGTSVSGEGTSAIYTSEFDIDYTLLFEQAITLLTSIDTHIASIDTHIASIDTHIASIDERIISIEEHIASIDERIISIEELANGQKQPGDIGGIQTHSNSDGLTGINRAILVNSLKSGNQLENVIDEYNNPTPVPGL